MKFSLLIKELLGGGGANWRGFFLRFSMLFVFVLIVFLYVFCMFLMRF